MHPGEPDLLDAAARFVGQPLLLRGLPQRRLELEPPLVERQRLPGALHDRAEVHVVELPPVAYGAGHPERTDGVEHAEQGDRAGGVAGPVANSSGVSAKVDAPSGPAR